MTSVSGTTLNGESNLLFNGSDLVFNQGNGYSVGIDGDDLLFNNAGDDGGFKVSGYADEGLLYIGEGYMSFSGGGLIVGGTTVTQTTGLIRATNDVIAFYSSDRRLKTNIVNIPNALEKVSMLNGVTFDWKEFEANKNKEIHANEGHDVGVIAQEVEKIFPEIVDNRENGYKAVKYDRLVAVLIEAVKELNDKVKELENKIK